MVVLTVGDEPLNGALGVSSGHEDDITTFRTLHKLFLSHGILFLI